MTTPCTSPDALILAFLSERTHATVPAIQAARQMTPAEVQSRLAGLESRSLVVNRQDKATVPQWWVYYLTAEGRRAISVEILG